MCVRIDRQELEMMCSSILNSAGIPLIDSQCVSEVLASADARGIGSHGVARLDLYLTGITEGYIDPIAKAEIIDESSSFLSVDAGGCVGQCVAKTMMEKVINKAETTGFGCCTIRNSNHFGIAGYYAEMAARHNMIGIAMTNTAALGVPTFGCKAMFGTNPIAFAVQGYEGEMFSLDMATTCVSRGKIEVYKRFGKPLPLGWAVGKDGLGTIDPQTLLDDMNCRRGGGLLPLGGEGDLFSGYKGYGLAILVDILCGVLSGGEFGQAIADRGMVPAKVSHFLAAIQIGKLRNIEEFKQDLSTFLKQLSSSSPAEGRERVMYAGQKEHEKEAESKLRGISLNSQVWDKLCLIAKNYGIEIPSVREDIA